MTDTLLRTGPFTAGDPVDPVLLDDRLRDLLPRWKGPAAVRQFHGGASNPTFLVTDEGTGLRYVLRKKPAGAVLESAHAVEREFRVMQALAATDVPVPPMLALCEDPGVLGTPFYVMAFVPGRIYRNNKLEDMSPVERTATYGDVARVLARLHAVDPSTVGLDEFGRPGGYFDRQFARWTRQYRAAESERIDSMERVIERLPARIPRLDESAIVHGDFRLENVMVAPDAPRVAAVLDWELATLGHPLSDVAFFCLFHHAEFMPWGSARDLDYAVSGIPDEAAFVNAYCEAAGRDGVGDWGFFLAFAAFRLAAIAQGVHRRRMGGPAPHADANGARDWADLALRLHDRDAPLRL